MVGEASTEAEAVARAPAVRPDVAVLDVRLPDGDGVSVCRELRARLPLLRCLMLTEGLTNREIGERMFLAEKTVKNYVSHVLAKLGMQRRTQAAIMATELRRPGRTVG